MANVVGTEEESPVRLVRRRRSRAVAIAWLLVVCWLLPLLARLTGADRVPFLASLLIPVLAVLPYVAAGVVVPLAAAALSRDRAVLVAAIAVAALFGALVLPRAVGGDGPRATGPVLRILTANLRYGNAGNTGLVALVRRTDADVLSVQEFTPEAEQRLAAAGLSRLLPYRVIDPRVGPEGTGLYSRYPLTPLRERRAALAMPNAMLAVPGAAPVRVTAAHPPAPIGPDIEQWTHDLRQVPRATPHGPVSIVAGDFNATLDHARLRELIGSGYTDAADATGQGLVPTFRPWPPITIDHVIADRRCAVLRVRVYLQPESDHRALFAELRLP